MSTGCSGNLLADTKKIGQGSIQLDKPDETIKALDFKYNTVTNEYDIFKFSQLKKGAKNNNSVRVPVWVLISSKSTLEETLYFIEKLSYDK